MCTGKGCSSATLDASHTSGGCGRAEGPMMMPPTAGGGGSVACPHRLHTLAPDRRRPPHVGVEQVTRSMAMNKVQVSSSTTEPVWWCVMCFRSPLALWKPLRGHLLHQYEPSWNEKAEVGGGALGSDNWSGNSRVHSSHARACKNVTVHNLDRGGNQAGKRRRIHDRRARRVVRKRQLGDGAGHPAGFLDRFQGPGGVQVIGRRGNNGVGLRKTRFQCGYQTETSGRERAGRLRGAEYLRPDRSGPAKAGRARESTRTVSTGTHSGGCQCSQGDRVQGPFK